MDDVITIAKNTASRVLQVKSVYLLLAIGIGIMAGGQLYGDVTAGLEQQYSLNLGLLLVSLVGVLSALVACFDLPRELREKTMVTILSKPIGRDRYLLGKYLGVCSIAVVTMGVMGGALLLLTSHAGGYRPSLDILKGLIMLFAAAMQLTAIGILLGTLVREYLAAIATLVILWATYTIGSLAMSSGGVGRTISLLLPNFRVMDAKPLVADGIVIDWSLVGGGVLLAALYSVVVLIVAGFVFRRKDIA